MHIRLFAIAIVLFIFSSNTIHAAQIFFSPELFISERWDDNIDLDYENEKDDYISTVGASLTSRILWRTSGIQLNYSPSYNSYYNNKELENWRHEGELLAWKQAGRNTRLELRNTYLRSNNPRDEVEGYDATGASQSPTTPIIEADRTRRGRNEYYTNLSEVRITNNFGAQDSVILSYQYNIFREVDPPSGEPVEDNDTSYSNAGLVYNFNQFWGIEFDGSFRDTNYLERTDSHHYDANIRILQNFSRTFSTFFEYRHTVLDYEQEGTDEDYNIYQPAVGIRYQFKDNVEIEISGAYRYQDYEQSEDVEGTHANSNINAMWEYRKGFFSITGGSGYEIDNYRAEDNGLNIYYETRLEAGYFFTHRFSSTIYGAYQYSEYPNQTPNRVDHYVSSGLSFEWQALQWMRIGLSYDYSQVQSDQRTVEYRNNTAMLSIRISPTTPFRLN